MLKEFRDFLLKGNLIVLAVAFVMGAAFAALVTALVTDVVTLNHRRDHRQGRLQRAHVHDPPRPVPLRRVHHRRHHVRLDRSGRLFSSIVKPVDAITKRFGKPAEEPGMSDEERRHQELLAALRGLAH